MKIIIKSLVYLLIILAFSFVLPRLIPGSPLFISDSDVYALNASLPEEAFNSFNEYYNPERPVFEQFLIYAKNLITMDLGRSFYYKLPVIDLITSRIFWTFLLSFVSIGISSGMGIPLGLHYAVKEGGRGTFLLRIFTGLQAVPVFVLAIVLQMILCFNLNLFPSSGAYTPGIKAGALGFAADVINHSVVPLLILVLVELPPIFILTYNACSRTKYEPYVEMAQYFNVSEGLINYNYILKNSLPEILSKMNIQFLYAISGILFVEAVFSYPGLGSLLRAAAFSRDYPLLQGILLFTGGYGIMVNILFETIIKKVNPRF